MIALAAVVAAAATVVASSAAVIASRAVTFVAAAAATAAVAAIAAAAAATIVAAAVACVCVMSMPCPCLCHRDLAPPLASLAAGACSSQLLLLALVFTGFVSHGCARSLTRASGVPDGISVSLLRRGAGELSE